MIFKIDKKWEWWMKIVPFVLNKIAQKGPGKISEGKNRKLFSSNS